MPVRKRKKPVMVDATNQAFKRRLCTAWDMYCAGAGKFKCAEYLGISHETFRLRFLKPQNWAEQREKFKAGEPVDPPWLAFPEAQPVKPKPVALPNQTLDHKQKRAKAFFLYCNNRSRADICEELDLSPATYSQWHMLGKWKRAKELVDSGEQVQISDELPMDVADMVSITQASVDIVKNMASSLLVRGIQHAEENWTDEEVLDQIDTLKKLLQSNEIIEGKKPEIAQQFNIMGPIESVKDQGDFDVELLDE